VKSKIPHNIFKASFSYQYLKGSIPNLNQSFSLKLHRSNNTEHVRKDFNCSCILFLAQWVKTSLNLLRVPTQFSKPNSMTFHDFSMTFVTLFPCVFKWYLHLQTGNSLINNTDVALMGSNSAKLAPCVVAVSHLKTKPTLLSISTTYLHCQI